MAEFVQIAGRSRDDGREISRARHRVRAPSGSGCQFRFRPRRKLTRWMPVPCSSRLMGRAGGPAWHPRTCVAARWRCRDDDFHGLACI